jgi:site-specific DNA-cytosine methylase
LGYTVSAEIINAKNYGVPQNRERIFILGMHVPTVCKEIINTGFQAKTDTSVKIIKGFLFQQLLNNLNEVKGLQETASKDLVCGLMTLNAITNGLSKKLTLSNEISKSHWQNFVGLSLKEMRELFITKPGTLVVKPSIRDGTLFMEENTSHSEEIELWQNIEKLWQSLWDEIYPEQSKSTTLTAILQTIEKKTFTYAEMLLVIVGFIIQLRNSSSHLWNEVLLNLIVLRGNTFYEPITNQTEEKLIGRSYFIRRSNLSPAQQPRRIFIFGSREGCPREIFFKPGDDGQALKQIIGGSQGNRVYDPSGTSSSLASQAGGLGAKTGLYAITRGRSTDPWKRSEIAPSRRLSDKDDIRVVDDSGQVAIPVLTPDRINKRQNGRRMKTDGEPSFTLTNQDRHGVFDGCRIRRLTPLEAERLMGLPDDWLKYGVDANGKQIEISDTQRYRMAGNGIVVPVVEHIIRELILC